MSEQLDAPTGGAGQPGGDVGRMGMICALTALGGIAAMFLLHPG